MGQYYKIVNIKKKQYITPHTFGDGAKLMEFSMSASGVLAGLAILLADGNGRGGGDLHSENDIVGSWAGDNIVVAGDYANAGKFVKEPSYSTEKQDYYLLSNDFVVMVQGPTDAKELNQMTKAMKGSYKSTEAGTLDGLLGGDAKFGPGPTIEIRDTFGIIIDDK